MSNEGKKDGQRGGVNISGIVGSVGGNIIGGDEITGRSGQRAAPA
jgi:hypothetical protein